MLPLPAALAALRFARPPRRPALPSRAPAWIAWQVGSVDGGVVAGQWSPDGEALALLTGAGQLLLMSKVRVIACEGWGVEGRCVLLRRVCL